jgi:hypothetical protein
MHRPPSGWWCAPWQGGQNHLMWFLLSSRLKAFLFTLALGLAAPRIARLLRTFGQRRKRAGGGTLTTTVPLTTADALDRIAIWARPRKKRRWR